MDPTFDPREVDALVRRAAIAKRESVGARIAADEAEQLAGEKYRAAASARDDLNEYLEVAITRAAERLVDAAPAVAALIGMRGHEPVAPGDIASPEIDGRDDTGGGACS